MSKKPPPMPMRSYMERSWGDSLTVCADWSQLDINIVHGPRHKGRRVAPRRRKLVPWETASVSRFRIFPVPAGPTFQCVLDVIKGSSVPSRSRGAPRGCRMARKVYECNLELGKLFDKHNKEYFQNRIKSVEVKWSNRLTSSAGITTYYGKKEDTVINLSLPLLSLRPKKDLVETLLVSALNNQDKGQRSNF